jgi:hypothetical protein
MNHHNFALETGPVYGNTSIGVLYIIFVTPKCTTPVAGVFNIL